MSEASANDYDYFGNYDRNEGFDSDDGDEMVQGPKDALKCLVNCKFEPILNSNPIFVDFPTEETYDVIVQL